MTLDELCVRLSKINPDIMFQINFKQGSVKSFTFKLFKSQTATLKEQLCLFKVCRFKHMHDATGIIATINHTGIKSCKMEYTKAFINSFPNHENFGLYILF